MAHEHRHGRVRISELPEVKVPNNTDVFVLNVDDQVTGAITYKDLYTALQVKISPKSDYAQEDPLQYDFIKNKPDAYIRDEYIPSLTNLY